jgi:hypothetical protein
LNVGHFRFGSISGILHFGVLMSQFYLPAVSLVHSVDLDSIVEVEQTTETMAVGTPKVIRQSSRHRSATPSKVQPSPITTRRNSRKTIGKFPNHPN